VRGAFDGFDLLVPDAEASKQFSASWKSALRKPSPLTKLMNQIRQDGINGYSCGPCGQAYKDQVKG
jgi:hypothetical protein